MIEGIRMKEFHHHLKNLFAKIRPFSSALIKQLWYYAIPTLVDKNPNCIIIHGGCKEIGIRAATEQSVAMNLMNSGKMSKKLWWKWNVNIFNYL